MLTLKTLKSPKGAHKNIKRIGRGQGSGQGTQAGKGHKGQLARSGGRVRRGFEGGQMPLHRRLPKFGFTNPFRVEYSVVNLQDLEKLDGDITPDSLIECNLVSRNPVKILGKGKLTKKLNVKAHKFSETAKKAIESAGGKVEVIS